MKKVKEICRLLDWPWSDQSFCSLDGDPMKDWNMMYDPCFQNTVLLREMVRRGWFLHCIWEREYICLYFMGKNSTGMTSPMRFKPYHYEYGIVCCALLALTIKARAL